MDKLNDDKLKMCPEELVALASSFAIALSKQFNPSDLETLKVFFSTLASNISLIQHQQRKCGNNKKNTP